MSKLFIKKDLFLEETERERGKWRGKGRKPSEVAVSGRGLLGGSYTPE